MCDGEQRRTAADVPEPARRAAVQFELRRTAVTYHLDVAPQHAARMAGSERLHRRFLGREPAGEVDRRHTSARAVRHLAIREDTPHEPIAITLDRRGDA